MQDLTNRTGIFTFHMLAAATAFQSWEEDWGRGATSGVIYILSILSSPFLES
jgi:hypothetical protein